MLNHARTLLLNKKPDNPQRCDFPGEELVDPAYVPIVWPTYLQTLGTQLYGNRPDRWMRNYRTRQLLTIVHASPLEHYLLELDSRLTYRFDADAPFVSPELFMPTIVQSSGPAVAKLVITGTPTPPDTTGQMYHALRVTVVDDTLTVERATYPNSKVVFDLEVDANSWSTSRSLAGTGLQCRARTDDLDASWFVEVVNRPQRDISDVVAACERVGEPTFISLFGPNLVEPYRTFHNAWHDAKELPLRLSGLLLAMIYRAEERRSARGQELRNS